MSGCTHDCSSCSMDCPSKKGGIQKDKANAGSNVKHIVAVMSGKGGVGKSLVTGMLAVHLSRKGYKVGILDADITGPSIPKAFGLGGDVEGNENGAMVPPATQTGIKVMSVNLMLEDETRPVVWRGSLIASTVRQFWTDTAWGDLDFLLVDCPPGTGDVPLTVFQSIPIDGCVIVSTPQDLVSMIVKKAANMADMMNVDVLGLVENMSFAKCPDCGKEIKIFGDSHIEEIAEEFGYELLAKLPIDTSVASYVDNGMIEYIICDYLDAAADKLAQKCTSKGV